MKPVSLLLFLCAFVQHCCGARPRLLPILTHNGTRNPNHYIVTLKSGVHKGPVVESVGGSVTHSDLLHGFAGSFNRAELDILLASDEVESMEEDGIFHAQAVETIAPWGLGRTSSKTKLASTNTLALNYSYYFDDVAQGQGVDVYVVDTGIYIQHVEFGGRASIGYTGPGLNQTDDNGHGTHVAGIVAGTRFGIAKKASVISVKVLGPSGSGSTATILAGLTWIQSAVQALKRPSVAVIALGGGASAALDAGVNSLIDAGIHVVVVAGNSNSNAANFSPARVPRAITVGASTIADCRSGSSNWGPAVDIYAPGVDITSAFIGSLNATQVLSGTSSSAGHVAGLVAIFISMYGNLPPDQVSARLWSQTGILCDIPSGSINRLAVGPITV